MNVDNVNEVKLAIKKARKWARRHFNANAATDTSGMFTEDLELKPPTCFVEFPDVDKMVVAPSFMGNRSVLSFEYRLCFNPLQWEGKHPFWGYPLPPLKVE